MIEVKSPINPLLAYGNNSEIKREEREATKMLSNYFGNNDVEVHL